MEERLKGATVLFTEMTPDMDWEEEFNEWYDTHQIPLRMGTPGFISAQRYCDADRLNYLSVYEMSAPDVLESEAYRKIRAQPSTKTRWMLENTTSYSRYLGNQISEQRGKGVIEEDALDAPVLYPVYFSVPDDRADEFNSWYEDEHVPMLLKCSDWLMVRRFEIYDGEPQPWTHLALHYLADLAALDSPERAEAGETKWRKKLAEEQWFRASYRVFDAFGERFPATS